MNQILSVEMENNKTRKKTKKANIKSVVILFSAILLIFGMSIISVGVFLQGQKDDGKANQGVTASTGEKPTVEIIQDVNKLNITVSSDIEIANVIYKWNNEEETQVNGNNEKSMELNITIPVGTNVLSIIAKDVNGIETSIEREYEGVEVYEPTISLRQEDNALKVVCESETNIENISYSFDNQEMQTQEVNDTTAEIEIEKIEGAHDLAITVTNENGEKYEDKKPIYVPIATVTTDGNNFIINAEDTRGIKSVDINFNDNEQSIDVGDTTYTNTIPLRNGENKIILVVYNEDGLSVTKRIRFER